MPSEDVLLFCEHPPVITLGEAANGRICWRRSMCCGRRAWSSTPAIAAETLPITGRDKLWDIDSEPGRDPARRRVVRADAGRAMIRATAEFGITAERCRKDGNLGRAGSTEEKLAAIGVH